MYLLLVADVFQVLAEPRRREMLALLADDERTAGDIAAPFDVTRQAVSQHLPMWPSALSDLKAAAEHEHEHGSRDGRRN